MHLVTLTCPSCGEDRPFQRPPCPDGHGDDCPECACVDCGTALFTGTASSGTAFTGTALTGSAAAAA